jgi:hypothetical protein
MGWTSAPRNAIAGLCASAAPAADSAIRIVANLLIVWSSGFAGEALYPLGSGKIGSTLSITSLWQEATMRSTRISFLVLLLAALCAATAVAAPPTARRFQMRLEASVVGDPITPSRCTDPMVLIELEGSGRSNVLGEVTAEASHCVIDDPADPGINDGVMTIVGEDGSIDLTYSGTDDDGDLNGVFIITGGTGAYAGASGEGTFTGIADRSTNSGSLQFRGRISVP